ncbi:MAG: PPC domain-containing protein, partial [Anaerolineales bacterium]|nr:PPC domain-containing protein [Anaerolineales bacterium]
AQPPGWLNLSERLNAQNTMTPFGVLKLLNASSERTGASLLAGKPVEDGAFALALLGDANLPAIVPLVGLGQVVQQMATAVSPLAPIRSITPGSVPPDTPAATVSLSGAPLPLMAHPANQLRVDVLYLLPPPRGDEPQTHILFLFGAPAAQWDAYAGTFAQMQATIAPRATAGAATTTALHRLQPGVTLNGALQKQRTDLWSFAIDAAQYLSVTLAPANNHLDLSLVIFGPENEPLLQLDNGFAGGSERLTDVWLPEAGLYLLAVNEFGSQAGSYTLRASLSAQPEFTGRGHMRVGESVQSRLAAEDQHVWRFDGAAGQRVSIVLMPLDGGLDVILNVYAPDNTRLVALDEGFSGDAELVSGFALPVTGAYTIVASSFASLGGPYALTLSQGGEQTANFYDAGDLIYGQTARETLRSSEVHAWFFRGQAGDEVTLTAVPQQNSLDLDLWLIDPDLNRLATQDANLAGEPEMLTHVLPREGEYIVLVREYDGRPGGYQLSLENARAQSPIYAGALALNTTATFQLAAGQTAFWQFEAPEGTLIDVTLQPFDVTADLVLTLQGPDGQTNLLLDETAVGEAETLSRFRLPAGGQWRILVHEFFGEAATYQLSVETQEP